MAMDARTAFVLEWAEFILGRIYEGPAFWVDFPGERIREGLLSLLRVLPMYCSHARRDVTVLVDVLTTLRFHVLSGPYPTRREMEFVDAGLPILPPGANFKNLISRNNPVLVVRSLKQGLEAFDAEFATIYISDDGADIGNIVARIYAVYEDAILMAESLSASSALSSDCTQAMD